MSVPGYRHIPGNHCGSTALRNLLVHHGLAISEEMVLGLGAGVSFFYVELDDQSPSRFFNGRAARLEEQFLELTGAPFALERFPDAPAASGAARDAVADGRPPLLLTDLYYLDHYGRSAHFPGHAVVLAGYDERIAYLSDTAFPDLQATTLASLDQARFGDHPIFPLSGEMVALRPGAELGDIRFAAPRAIAFNAERMLESPLGEYEGLPAMRRFAAEVSGWPETVADWQWCARFGYQVIQRRGTGGGNFRLMYSRFLAECAEQGIADLAGEARVAATAAGAWTGLARELEAASVEAEPTADRWAAVGDRAAAVLALEERLWPELRAAVG